MKDFDCLRRAPDEAPGGNLSGYNFWPRKLERLVGDFAEAEMVEAFTSSDEYRQPAVAGAARGIYNPTRASKWVCE